MSNQSEKVRRSTFVKGAAAAGATLALGGIFAGLRALSATESDSVDTGGEWVPSTCQGCTSWCAVQVYVQNGRAIKVRGNPNSRVNRGEVCPKSHLALQQVYDPDRIKTPMKRTNPRKGREEDPGFVPISWDEALDTVAEKIMELRRNGETHKYLLMRGRYTYMRDVLYDRMTKIIGSPNNISHSSICAEAEKFGPYYTEGAWAYRQYDVLNSNYVLLWGADPVSTNRQVSYYLSAWGEVLDRATVAVIDPRFSASAAKADHWLPIKPGEDGALAVALAHVILSEGLWHRDFVGDFTDGQNRFVPGQQVDEEEFTEKHTSGVVRWWNIELNDKTPRWAAERTGLTAEQIREIGIGFGKAAPRALCWVGGGPAMQRRGSYSAMAAHALNGLVGSVDNVGGTLLANPEHTQSFPGADGFMDQVAQAGVNHEKIDQRGRKELPSLKEGKPGSGVVTNNVADAILQKDPYDIKVAIGYMNNFTFSCPDSQRWERAMAEVPFLAHITTHASELSFFADIVLPAAHELFERWGYVKSHANGHRHVTLLQPCIEPVWGVKTDETEVPWELAEKLAEKGFPNLLEHYREYKDPETDTAPYDARQFSLYALKHATHALWDPQEYVDGDRFEGWEQFRETGVWNSGSYPYRTRWGAMRTKTNKFEFYSETLRDALSGHAQNHQTSIDDILATTGYLARGERAFVPHYEEPLMQGNEDQFPLVLVDYKSRFNREGRSANCPWYQELKELDPGDEAWQDVAKLNPIDAEKFGIENGDPIRVVSETGTIECHAKLWEGVRPGTVQKCYGQGHWAYGRVAAEEFGKRPRGGNNNEIIPAEYDRLSGSTAFYAVTRVRVERT